MFNKTFVGVFGRDNEAPGYSVEAIVTATDNGTVSLAIPAGDVKGTMNARTAFNLGSALISASGEPLPQQAQQAPPPPATANADAFIPAGSYAEYDEEDGTIRLYLANGAQFAAFVPQTRFVLA